MMRGIGGFQYSDSYLDSIWSKVAVDAPGALILNTFQLYPPSFFRNSNTRKLFYVDQTLKQLFSGYPDMAHASQSHKTAAVIEEKYQYSRAERVICMCKWTASSVLEQYSVPRDKIAVVHPGGNISRYEFENWQRTDPTKISTDGLLRFVFVGMDAKRKGLLRFLEAMRLLSGIEKAVSLSVIGIGRAEIPAVYADQPGVIWYGRIDKNRDMKKFVDVLGGNHIGVLLSQAEATGLSLREFQMLGLGVLAPDVGGAPEMVAKGAGILVAPDAQAGTIAGLIESLVMDRNLVISMREAAWNAREEMTWRDSAKQIAQYANWN